MRGKFSVEQHEGKTVITYQDDLIRKHVYVSNLNQEEAESWKQLLELAYTYGASNAVQAVMSR